MRMTVTSDFSENGTGELRGFKVIYEPDDTEIKFYLANPVYLWDQEFTFPVQIKEAQGTERPDPIDLSIDK